MNAETTRKIIEAIAECDQYIAIESPRSADLRPAATTALLEKYKAHRSKLAGMLPPSSAKG
jgi:hypothetical protein